MINNEFDFKFNSPLSDTNFIEEFSYLDIVKELSKDDLFMKIYNKTVEELFPDYINMPSESWHHNGYVIEGTNDAIEIGLYRDPATEEEYDPRYETQFCIEFFNEHEMLACYPVYMNK